MSVLIMKGINPVLQAVNEAVEYLQKHSWRLFLLLACAWVVKTQGMYVLCCVDRPHDDATRTNACQRS
jgi:hypothetical protein